MADPSPTALQNDMAAAGLRSAKVDYLVPAGGVIPVEIPGMSFRVLESDTPLQIRYDSGPFIPHDIGTGQILPAPLDQNGNPRQTYFRRLEIRNTSLTTASNVTLFIGTDSYIDDRLNLTRLAAGKYLPVMEGKTRLAAWANSLLAAGASLVLDGVAPVDGGDVNYRDIKRQSVLVTNNDAAAAFLEVRDGGGRIALRIFPSKNVMLPISEGVTIHNPGAGDVSCQIGEIWTTAHV